MNIIDSAQHMNTTATDYLHFLRKFHPWGTKNHKKELRHITDILTKNTEIPYRYATNHRIRNDTGTTSVGVGKIEIHIQQFLKKIKHTHLKCLADGHCLRRAIAKRLEMHPGHLIHLIIDQIKTILRHNPRGLSNEAHVNTYINNQTNNIKQTMWTYINKMIKFTASHFIYDNKHNYTPDWGGDLELRQTAILTGTPVVVLTNHPRPNMLITIHWPSIETRVWHSNKAEDIDRVHQILETVYENVIYVMYNNHNHYNAIIPEEISNPKPTRAPIQIKRNLPHKKQLQRYHEQSLNTSALSLSLDLLTATTQCHAEFASSEPDSSVESSSLSSLSARLRLLLIFLFFRWGMHVVSFSWADSDDSCWLVGL